MDAITGWRQAGSLFVWRHALPGDRRRGWHFNADPPGARSIAALLRHMQAYGQACYRTVGLDVARERIWRSGHRGPRERFARMRVAFEPMCDALMLDVDADAARLTMRVGTARIASLAGAFADVGAGREDFAIVTSDERRPEPWIFWSMPAGPAGA